MTTRSFVTFLVVLCAFVSLVNSQTVAQSKKDVTLHGELVDVVSFVSWGSKQEADMVKASALAGNPIGFYDTRAKKLYIAGVPELKQSPRERLLPYVGVRVFVTGKVYTKAGVNVIIISDVGKSIK